MPVLREEKRAARGNVARDRVSGACQRVGRGEKRAACAKSGALRQPEESLVDMRKRPFVACGGVLPHFARYGVPGLHRQAGACGENDLATLYPDIAAQWDETKDGALRPSNVTAGSNRPVWRRCERGHSYRAIIAQRVQRGNGCPYCANRKVLPGFNDLATAAPLVAKQWHETLNGALTPEIVTAGSHRKAWWQCPYGHVWKAVIYARTGAQQSGCPVCAGKTKSK